MLKQRVVVAQLGLVLTALASAGGAAAQTPPIPEGATRILNFDRAGARIAVCGGLQGDPILQGARSLLPTAVWAGDGRTMRRLSAGPAACDPAWSRNAQQLAVTALDGLWIFAGGSMTGALRVRALPRAGSGSDGRSEFDYRAFSHPRWSSDGTMIALLVTNGGTSWVEAFEASSGSLMYTSPPETYSFDWGSNSRSLKAGDTTIGFPDRR